MSYGFTQLHLADMEHGLAQVYAVFGLAPQQITSMTGVKFDTAKEDGFEYLLGALLETDDRRQFSLRQYYPTPYPEKTELIGSENSVDPIGDLRNFLDALSLPHEYLLWHLSGLAGRFKQLQLLQMQSSVTTVSATISLTPRQIRDLTGIYFQSCQTGEVALLQHSKTGDQFSLHRPFGNVQNQTQLITSGKRYKGYLEELRGALDIPEQYVVYSL